MMLRPCSCHQGILSVCASSFESITWQGDKYSSPSVPLQDGFLIRSKRLKLKRHVLHSNSTTISLELLLNGSMGNPARYDVTACLVLHSLTNIDFSAISWDEAAVKADGFLALLNQTEKISIVTGALGAGAGLCTGNIRPNLRVGFKGLCLLDGPTSINAADLVSVFPAGITVASTWDKSLMFDRGVALGEEFRGKGGNVALGYDNSLPSPVPSTPVADL